ncbi:hypothetical protein MP638_003360 [Amoeboaphelidium occidentale]|nr:hypothetical protein MP638_003360 [Amoeboaphelidium occidentale]
MKKDYGSIEWKSVYVMSHYLITKELISSSSSSSVTDSTVTDSTVTVVVEVSAGMCFLSRQLVKLKEEENKKDIRIIATDLPHLQQQLQKLLPTSEVMVLRFGSEEDIMNFLIQEKLCNEKKRIIFACSDVLYEDGLIHGFFYTISRLLLLLLMQSCSSSSSCCCFLAYECRSLKKMDLILALCEDYYDLRMEKISYNCKEVLEYCYNKGLEVEVDDFKDVELYRIITNGN